MRSQHRPARTENARIGGWVRGSAQGTCGPHAGSGRSSPLAFCGSPVRRWVGAGRVSTGAVADTDRLGDDEADEHGQHYSGGPLSSPSQSAVVGGLAQEVAAGSAEGAGENDSDPEKGEEHTSELQSLMRSSYAVFCLKKKKNENKIRK